MTIDIIFLDFDGVTHPREFNPGGPSNEQTYFCFLPMILSAISAAAPQAKIVVSSAWRNWPDFNQITPPHLLNRIAGVTPNIPRQYDGVREDEALAWIRANIPAHQPVRWLAIDDTLLIWRSSAKVVLCDDGFRDREYHLLIQTIQECFDAEPVEVTGFII